MLGKNLLIVFLLLKEILSFCEEAHIVICDDISDLKNNETGSWRYLQIGSTSTHRPHQVLERGLFTKLRGTKSLTVINRINRLDSPFVLTDQILLQHLNFFGNDIVEIDDHAFSNLRRLKEVYLRNNKVQHLGQGIFENSTLEIVDLSQNSIRTVTTAFYRGKVNYILLNHNKIVFIRNEAFPSSLVQLDLSHNLLESLEERVFANLRNLKELVLEHNRLTTLPNIANLQQIHYLHLAHNKIKQVHYPFNQHPKMEYIDLSSNLIGNVTTHVFASSSPPLVRLNFNRLTNIVFERPKEKTDLTLYGNPWNCDCWFQIEKTISKYHHVQSCEVHFFDNGELPLCIENGKCGIIPIVNSDMNNFLDNFRSCEDEIFKLCKFRL